MDTTTDNNTILEIQKQSGNLTNEQVQAALEKAMEDALVDDLLIFDDEDQGQSGLFVETITEKQLAK